MKTKSLFRLLTTILGVLFATALIAAGCGSDDDDVAVTTTTAAPVATTAAPEAPATTAAPATTEAPDTTAAPETTTAAAPAEEPLQVGLVYDIGGRGDLSFNDSAYAGLERAIEDLGISGDEVSPNSDGSNRASLLQLQAERADLVLGIGFLFANDMREVAALNPEVCFAIVDGVVEDPTDNIAMLLFAEHEGSFLVGAAAALKSQTNSIGFIGGVNNGLIQRFEAGYAAGARAINPNIEISAQYISEPPDFSGFSDPASAKVIAQTIYEGGADIIYQASGGSGAGVFEAAKEFSDSSGSKVWAIGTDSDQFFTVSEDIQEFILTSMLKRVDVSIYDTIEAANGGECLSGIQEFDLVNNGVGYSTSGGFLDDIVDQLDDFRQQIIDGEIEVPSAL